MVDLDKNGCGHSCHKTVKLPVSQEGISGINLFLACWYRIREAKSYWNNCWVGVVKNVDDL